MVQLQENLTHKFIKRGSWLYLFAFLSGPLGYAIKIMISHDLTVSQVGVLYGVLSFIILVFSINDMGMVESLNHFVPKFLAQNKKEKAKSFFIYAGVTMLLTSIISGILLWLGSQWLSIVYFWSGDAIVILHYFCIYLFFSNIQHFVSTIFLIYQDTKFAKGLDALRLFVSLGFAYQIYHVGQGSVEEYAGIWNYGVVVSSLFGIYIAWKHHLWKLFRDAVFQYSHLDLKELFQYSIWALLASNISLFLSQLDVQLLLLMRGTAEVGIYSNYLSLIGIPFLVLTPVMGLIFPVVSAYHGASRLKEITTIATTFTRAFSILWLFTIGIAVLYADGSGVFFFGEKFRDSGYVLLYSIGFIIFNFLLQINFNVLAAVGKVKARLRITSMGLVVNLLLNLICIHYYGANGSALAVGISWIFLWYFSYRETREYHDPFSWKTFLKNLVFCTMLTVILWKFFPREIGEIGRTGYFISLSLSTIFFAAGFILINRDEILNAYRTLKKPKP